MKYQFFIGYHLESVMFLVKKGTVVLIHATWGMEI